MALKETILQQSMVAFGLFEIQFFHAQPQTIPVEKKILTLRPGHPK